MTLAVEIAHAQGRFHLDVAFEAPDGLVALFGRSGSGKTSVINIIAGLVRPDRARIVVGGTTLIDTAKGIDVPPHKRRVGYVFQEPRLFPHLSVRQNLLYGRWFALGRTKPDGSLSRVVDLLGLEALLDRAPGRLSGGERQRVALGRALLAEPRILLMDEPLSALDAARKAEILPYIERLRDASSVPIVYVSHALTEVVRLATSIVLLTDGKVTAAGPAADVMLRLDLPELIDRADAGALIEARVEAHETALGLTRLQARSGLWRLPQLGVEPGTAVRIRVRARDVMLARTRPQEMSALNVLRGTVVDISHRDGPVVDLRLDCQGDALIARLTRYSAEHLDLRVGAEVYAVIKSVSLDRHGPAAAMPASALATSDIDLE